MTETRTIRKAIKRKFPAININDTLGTALKMMSQDDVSVLAVKFEKELVGIVTVADVMFSLTNQDDLQKTTISNFMTKCEFTPGKETRNPCIQLDEDEDALSAIKVMYEAGVNHLLVSGTGGEPVGIVSSLEIVKLLAK